MRLTPVVVTQQLVGAILDPPSDIGVRRAAICRVVLDAAVFRRVMRWCYDDAVAEMIFAPSVVDENGARDDRSRRNGVVLLDDGRYVIGRQDLERCALRRPRERVRVL